MRPIVLRLRQAIRVHYSLSYLAGQQRRSVSQVLARTPRWWAVAGVELRAVEPTTANCDDGTKGRVWRGTTLGESWASPASRMLGEWATVAIFEEMRGGEEVSTHVCTFSRREPVRQSSDMTPTLAPSHKPCINIPLWLSSYVKCSRLASRSGANA